MKFRVFAARAAVEAAALPAFAYADTPRYKYAFPAPPVSLLNRWVMMPFAAAGGAIEKLRMGQ